MQELERSRHLPAAQVALATRDVVEEVDLALVDEQPQLARLVKINLRGQQGHGFQRVARPGAQGRSRHGQMS